MKRISLILAAILLLFSTGCTQSGVFSNYRPIEQLKLVHTMGFDVSEEGVELSICGGEQELTRLSCTGRNISDCLAQLQSYSEKTELYYAHTRYVIVGEDYARRGLGDVMQYLESGSQLRSDLPLFVVKGGTARDLVLHSGGKEQGVHDVLEAVLRDCEDRGTSYPFTCGDIGSFCAEYGSALACALEVTKTKDRDPQAEDDEVTPIAAGYAVIDLGTAVGFLSREASQGVNLLMDEAGTEPMTLILNGSPVSLRFTDLKTTLSPTFGERGTMTALTVGLEGEAVLEETEQSRSVDKEKLRTALERTLRQWIEEVLVTMRETQCDFLGFGPRIAVSAPHRFSGGTLPWSELSLTAEVRCSIRNGENESGSKEVGA